MSDSTTSVGGSAIDGTAKLALGILTFGYFVGFAGVVVYAPVANEFADIIGLSGLMLGLLVATPTLTGSLLRIPFSAWADSVGAKKPFAILLGLSIVGMGGLLGVLISVYPNGLSMVHYPIIFVFGALSGCGIAAYSVGITDTAYWFKSKNRGTMLAIFAGLGTLSPGLFVILQPMMFDWIGITGTYAVWFAFLVIGTAIFVYFAIDSPYFQYRKKGLDEREAKQRASDDGQDLFPSGNAKESLREAATIYRTWLLTAMFFVSFGGYLALTSWFIVYWQNYHGLGLRTAGLISAAAFIIASPLFRASGGAISDRFGGEETTMGSFGVVILSSIVMTLSPGYYVAVAATVALGAGLGIASAAIYQLLPQYVPEAVGGASGIVGGLGAFGGFAIPPVLGYIVDVQGTSGYANGFAVFLVLGVMSLGIASKLYIAEPAQAPTPTTPAPGDD